MPANKKHRGRGNVAAPEAPPVAPVYDGPGESSGRGRAQSSAGASQRPQSQVPSQAGEAPSRDPARDPPPGPTMSRNVDFGGQAYDLFSTMPTTLAKRQGIFGKAGKKAIIEINSHIVKEWPTRTVYQYDVNIGSGDEKRGLIRKIWASKTVQSQLGQGFIFDGNKIAWSPHDFANGLRMIVDLDAEEKEERDAKRAANPQPPPPPPAHPRPPRQTSGPRREKRENKFPVRISKAKNNKIYLSVVKDYLDGKCDFNEGCLEGINFLDHLLRETPSKELINLRRSYFARHGPHSDRYLVGNGVEAMKGIYQSIRMAEGRRLVINVDVSNSTFWQESNFSQIGQEMAGAPSINHFIATVVPQPDGKPGRNAPLLKRLVKNNFYIKHRGQLPGQGEKLWTVKRISEKNAKTHEFEAFDATTGKNVMTTVFAYYLKKYNVRLDKWQLPLLETNKRDVLFPMELAIMAPAQRYPYRLNEQQTASMIKFAVSRPPVRRQGIQNGLSLLKWGQDPMLSGYGLKIDPNFLKTTARVLEPPEVQYKGSTAKPMYSGRWDLRGKVFAAPNFQPLKSWGICVIPGGPTRPTATIEQVNAFKDQLIKSYQGHGGNVVERNPPIVMGVVNPADALEKCFQNAGNKANARPQLLVVILPMKSSDLYQRIKKNCDCRFGVMSQCVQGLHVIKNAPQYASNVLMKVNCKLGGTTCTLKSKTSYYSGSTMIIGADVSHAAPGLEQASMAAMTVSLDKTCSRYGAAVQSNGKRVEMIVKENIQEMLEPLAKKWMMEIGGGRPPKHVYYFRDGVSEGQYIPLLRNEVADIKEVFDILGQKHPDNLPKFTVVVAEKRHHIRFFPPNGPAADKNGNPVPGTIVDRDVTHPFDNDVYLCSHAAIQGTARPTHYTILMDEMGVDVDKFQALLYDHCYQYQRATTPVSLFPAVYYAHLASKRAEAHIDMGANARIALQEARAKIPGQEVKKHSDQTKSWSEWPKLVPFEKKDQIHLGMWYI